MSHRAVKTASLSPKPHLAHPSHSSSLVGPSNASHYISTSSQGMGHLGCPAPESNSSPPLTKRNITEHDRQQSQRMSFDGHHGISPEHYFAKLHQEHITTLVTAGRSLDIDPSQLQKQRKMQNSMAATPLEWYLAEDDHHQRTRVGLLRKGCDCAKSVTEAKANSNKSGSVDV